MPSKEEVGRRIRCVRFRRGMTLKEVAAASSLSATHISEIERGNASPTVGALQRIAHALGERPACLVEETEVPTTVLTRRHERQNEYTCDAEGRTLEVQKLTRPCPWARLHIVRKLAAPGDVGVRPPASAECVIMCLKGAIRVTAGGSSTELRSGDTMQFRMDDGVRLEAIGDRPVDSMAFTAYEGRSPW